MTSKLTAYTIENIKEWQAELANASDNQQTGKIILPSLQRGFVWKPSQIEALWDSILRGYPVGSVLMSVDETSQNRELLDGQQRCTSIALGFYNPFDQKAFRFFNAGAKKNIVPSVWIDLKPMKPNPNGLKFGIRVLTKSHPWGYQLNDHTTPLSMSDRKKAFEQFQKLQNGDVHLSYADLNPENIYPFDSHCPVPLALLLTAFKNNPDDWKKVIINWYEERKDKLYTKYSHLEETHDLNAYLVQLEPSLKNAFELQLPEIKIQKKLLNETENTDNEENSDATLFVRLNSEGTRISGEELIYSLFKSAFPESQTLVEEISSDMFAPSRTINLFVRLALHELNDYSQYRAELSIKNFRQELSNSLFKNKMEEYISNEAQIAKQLFRKLIDTFSIESAHFKLPKVYIKELVKKNPDLVVVILSYFHHNKTVSANIKKILHHLFLLNFDGKKTARALFYLLNDNAWDLDEAFEKLVQNPDLMMQVIPPTVFKEMIVSVLLPEYQKNKEEHFGWVEFLEKAFDQNSSVELKMNAKAYRDQNYSDEKTEKELIHAFLTNFKYLADNFYWHRIHLIAAQAQYFHEQFKDFLEFEGLEDTNRPWDWDHIYPHSWVYNRKSISQNIRWIVNLNGNFRALSYDENRSENNTYSPSERLQDSKYRKNAFVFSDDQNSYLNDWQFWQQLNKQYEDNKNNVELISNAFFYRVVNIYKNWYDNIYAQNG